VTVDTTLAVCWPARLAYAAALLFSAASTITNFLYGIAKGTDFGTSLIWATVSVAVSIVFALSWPALMLSIESRSWSRVLATLFALLLTGSYSITAALGSASGGRTNAAMAEHAITEQRTKLQTSYDAAKAELDGLKPSRPAAEIEALLMGAQWWKPPKGCTADEAKKRVTCPALEGELARSRQRERLKADLERATADLDKVQPAKVANSDAAALAGYLSAVGLDVSADRVNRLLVLLTVLVMECCGGLALTVGMALSTPKSAASSAETRSTVELSGTEQGQQAAPQRGDVSTVHNHGLDTRSPTGHRAPRRAETSATDTQQFASSRAVVARPDVSALPVDVETDNSPLSVAGVQFLAYLRERGGVLVAGQRAMAGALGWSKSWTNVVLHELAGAGLVKLNTGRSGTVVQLAA
jgi:hypothetical protein